MIGFLFQFIKAATYTSGQGLTEWQNSLTPFLVALISTAAIVVLKNAIDIGKYALEDPVPEINEFKADMIAYLNIMSTGPFIRSLRFLRENQIKNIISLEISKGLAKTPLTNVKDSYNRFFEKGIYARQYSSWLEYFKENYGKLIVTQGVGFELPTDSLRTEFLLFIDKLCKSKVALRIIKDLKSSYINRRSFLTDNVGIIGWLKDINMVAERDIEKVIKYMDTHPEFNAQVCSLQTGVELYDVLVTFLFLMVDGALIV
jgi:hypothetical protein